MSKESDKVKVSIQAEEDDDHGQPLMTDPDRYDIDADALGTLDEELKT